MTSFTVLVLTLINFLEYTKYNQFLILCTVLLTVKQQGLKHNFNPLHEFTEGAVSYVFSAHCI